MTKNQILLASGTLLLVFLSWWLLSPAETPPEVAPTPTASSTPERDVATKPAPPATKGASSLTVAPSDSIASWNFVGAYAGDDASILRVTTEIARLTGLIGSGEYPDYILYVSIANQYDLLGDGAQEFSYLKKAIALDAGTGLAWHNAGQLFARLGAYATARTAFEQAVAVEPTVQYHQALLYFLQAHYPNDTAAIAAEENILGQ